MDRRRRTMTLWEQLTTAPDPAIRDFLKIPHDDNDGDGEPDRRPCTLMDAIGQEARGESGGGGGGMITLMDAIGRDIRGESGGGMINWKPLRDRLRLRRPADASSTTTSNRRADEDGISEEEEESKDEAPAAASTSLMALLEQADSQWEDEDEEDEDVCGSASKSSAMAGDEDEENGEGREEEMVRACCVCTVRHKGAAFIPCGHTFCRLCSRELWLTRASCPLCNAFIHDILHIF